VHWGRAGQKGRRPLTAAEQWPRDKRQAAAGAAPHKEGGGDNEGGEEESVQAAYEDMLAHRTTGRVG
jgi:hypothetical protein